MAKINGKSFEYVMNQPGRHNVINSLAVIAVLIALKVDWRKSASFLASMPELQKRNERIIVPINGGTFQIIDDTANANPASMVAAFEHMNLIKVKSGGEKIAVLFDIRQLGSQSKLLHQQLATPLINSEIDKVYCYGEDMYFLYQALPKHLRGFHTTILIHLISRLLKEVKANDVILFKGSPRLSFEMKTTMMVLSQIKEVSSVNSH